MGARVLVVDDEPSILRAIAANLRARGYEALTAASGRAALRMIETHQPDCILLDLGLPDVGGLEVLRRLRALATTPVVIVSAVDDERAKATALDLGADDYVTKPFTMTELLARVRGLCSMSIPTRSGGPKNRSPNASPTESPSSESHARSIGFMGRSTYDGRDSFPSMRDAEPARRGRVGFSPFCSCCASRRRRRADLPPISRRRGLIQTTPPPPGRSTAASTP